MSEQYIDIVTSFLQNNSICYQLIRHEAVVSVEDSKKVLHIGDCMGCKSLFVKDKKSPTYYMVILPSDKRAEMRALAEQVGHAKFEFVAEQNMYDMLGVTRGNVSPFCYCIADLSQVVLLLDKQVAQSDRVRFHPCDNTASVILATKDFLQCMRLLGVRIVVTD